MNQLRFRSAYAIFVLQTYLDELWGQHWPREIIGLVCRFYQSLCKIKFSCGFDFTYAIVDQVAYGWGRNEHCELGLGHMYDRLVPTKLNLPGPVKSISCGSFHSVAVLDDPDQTVWVWGSKNLGLGPIIEIAKIPTKIDLPPIRKVCCGSNHSMVLDLNSNVYGWGNCQRGQLGLGHTTDMCKPMQLPDFKASSIKCGYCTTTALDLNFEPYMWGNGILQPTKLTLGLQINKIRCGLQLYVSDLNNKLYERQDDSLIEVGIDSVKNFSCGNMYTAALTTQHQVWIWGSNNRGQLGLGDNIDRKTPTKICLKSVRKITCGIYHTIALTTNFRVYVWGEGACGRLGLENGESQNVPTELQF